MGAQNEQRDDGFEESVANLYTFDTPRDRLRAKECIGIAKMRLENSRERRSAVLAFAEAVLHGDEEHRIWLMEAAECWVAGRDLPVPRSGTKTWIPEIGERVRVADHCVDAELWNRDTLYVAGISHRRLLSGAYGPEIDVTISSSWPEITDPTDGFIIGHASEPDQILPA